MDALPPDGGESGDRHVPSDVRVFFALVPGDAVRGQFLALARDVGRRARGRAVSGEHVHLTLAFVGDVRESDIPALVAIGDRMPRVGAVLQFDTFGAWRASGVAWIAPSEVPAPLGTLQAALREALVAAGFPVDERPFRPHVTLARRCVQPQPRGASAPVRWPVDRLCLIGSQLRPEGPAYTELAGWSLATGSA